MLATCFAMIRCGIISPNFAPADREKARTPRSAPAWIRRIRVGIARLTERVSSRIRRPRSETGLAAYRTAESAVSKKLTEARIGTIRFDFATGTAMAVFVAFLLSAVSRGATLGEEVFVPLFSSLLGFVVASAVSQYLLKRTAAVAGWGAGHWTDLSRWARIVAVAGVIAGGAIAVGTAGTFLANTLAFLLPSAFVTACGLWVCRLAFRRWHMSARNWLRTVPDAVAAATSGAALLLLVDRGLLTTLWATVLLFPVAIAGSLRLWAVMRKAGRLVIRAGADITLSLLLGGELVLFLVWLGNVFGIPESEVELIRTELGSAGSYAGIYDGGRLWVGIYAVLAVVYVAFVMHPGQLKLIIKWFTRSELPKVVAAAQRVVTGFYVGMLTIVFVGAAAPPVSRARAAAPAQSQLHGGLAT